MGIMRRKEFLSKNIKWFFSCQFPAGDWCVRDHPTLSGKFIPQSGKNLPTSGICLEKHVAGMGACDAWSEAGKADGLERG
jgi:hypothetical protein